MAKKNEEKKTKVTAAPVKVFGDVMPPRNKVMLAAGILVVILGFYTLGRQPVDGFISTVLAPILLVLGFLVLIPVGLVLRDKKEEPDQQGNVKR